MNRQYRVQLLLLLLALFAFAARLFAGGWAIITLNDFPDYAVAGKPLNLTFTIRQHGRTLLGGLRPTIRATTPGGLKATAKATPAAARGEYSERGVDPGAARRLDNYNHQRFQ